MKIGTLMLEAMESIGRLHEEAGSPEEKERLLVAFDALKFVFATGQPYNFESYRESRAANGPPLVTATFNTREEAEVWMRNHPDPPHHANVLIAGEYFSPPISQTSTTVQFFTTLL